MGLRLRALMGEVWLRLKDTAGAAFAENDTAGAAFPEKATGAAFPFVIASNGTAN